MSNSNPSPPVESIAEALVLSNDAGTIKRLTESLQELAIFPEVCGNVTTVLALLNRRKFDAVITDLQKDETTAVVEAVRCSPSNRTAVIFAVSADDTETISAFKAGCNFVLRKPLSIASIGQSLKVAYGLILRERRRYFRCRIQISAVIHRAGMPEIRGQTLNISESGMAISPSVSLPPGTQVQVHFTLPGRESQFALDAAIRWCREDCLGLQFISVSPRLKSELQEWLLERLEERLPESLADRFRTLGSAPQ